MIAFLDAADDLLSAQQARLDADFRPGLRALIGTYLRRRLAVLNPHAEVAMSRNVPANRRRIEVMAAPLEHFLTWDLHAQCANCGEQKRLFVADLARRFGQLPIRDVAGRLRCLSRVAEAVPRAWYSAQVDMRVSVLTAEQAVR